MRVRHAVPPPRRLASWTVGLLLSVLASAVHSAEGGISARLDRRAIPHVAVAPEVAAVTLAGPRLASLTLGRPADEAPRSSRVGPRTPAAEPSAMVATTAPWQVGGTQSGEQFGGSVQTAGDVNGDGYSDLVVGSPNHDGPGLVDAGRISIYYGGPSGLALTPGYVQDGIFGGGYFGFSVATAGDVNGDAFDDVLVGAMLEPASSPADGAGRVHLLLGSAAGPVDTYQFIGQPNDRYGSAVSTAGDVNGDGFDDFLIGSWMMPVQGVQSGGVDVFLGRAVGSPQVAQRLGNGQAQSGFGKSVSTAGDVNGDGLADIVIGAPAWDRPGVGDCGAASVYLSNGSSVPFGGAQYTVFGDISGASAGSSVSTAGDYNGDGFADVLVGIPYMSYSFGMFTIPFAGDVRVLRGSAIGIDSDRPAGAIVENATLGSSVATGGDMNGDGRADVIAGSPGVNSVAIFGGRKPWAGVNGAADQDLTNAPPNGTFGGVVACAGDVNGDGFGDIAVGAVNLGNGTVFVYHGAYALPDTSSAQVIDGDTPNGGLGALFLVGAGDVDGDGFGDLLMNNNLEFTASSRAWLFHGRPGGPGKTPDWVSPAGDVYVSAPAGDVNGDGFDDIVSTNQGTAAEPFHLRLDFYKGSATGLGGAPAWTWTDSRDNSGARPTLSPIPGDVNGDGWADVLVGDPVYSNGQPNEGRARLFLGSSSGPGSTPAWTVESDTAMTGFGFALTHAGDVNGDGFGDVIVAAPSRFPSGTLPGRIYLYLGSAAGLSSAPAWEAFFDAGAAEPGGFGLKIAAGDFNGDGLGDLAAETYDAPYSLAVWFGSGSGFAHAPDQFIVLAQPGAGLWWLVGLGDINGDGFDDLSWRCGGRAVVRLGSPMGFTAAPSASIVKSGAVNGDILLLSDVQGPLGDLDGDGFPEIALLDKLYGPGPESSGRLWIHTHPMLFGLDRAHDQRRVNSGAPIALLGGSSGPEVRLQSVGRTPAGRAWVRMRQEIETYQQPFDGLGTTATSWERTGSPVAVRGSFVSPLVQDVPVPDATRPTMWRQRLECRSPFFPRAPWISHAGNGRLQYDLRFTPVGTGGVEAVGGAPGVELAAPSPNPSRTRTTIRFRLPTRMHVAVTVLDVAGREIARLADGTMEDGWHSVEWGAHEGTSAAAGPGIYFVRVGTPHGALTRKLVRVRG